MTVSEKITMNRVLRLSIGFLWVDSVKEPLRRVDIFAELHSPHKDLPTYQGFLICDIDAGASLHGRIARQLAPSLANRSANVCSPRIIRRFKGTHTISQRRLSAVLHQSGILPRAKQVSEHESSTKQDILTFFTSTTKISCTRKLDIHRNSSLFSKSPSLVSLWWLDFSEHSATQGTSLVKEQTLTPSMWEFQHECKSSDWWRMAFTRQKWQRSSFAYSPPFKTTVQVSNLVPQNLTRMPWPWKWVIYWDSPWVLLHQSTGEPRSGSSITALDTGKASSQTPIPDLSMCPCTFDVIIRGGGKPWHRTDWFLGAVQFAGKLYCVRAQRHFLETQTRKTHGISGRRLEPTWGRYSVKDAQFPQEGSKTQCDKMGIWIESS